MALRQIRLGSLVDVHQYDDGTYSKSMEVEDPISCSAAPVDGSDVVRLDDLANYVLGPVGAVDSNLAEFDGITGKVIKDGGLSHADTYDAISKKHIHADVTQDITVVTAIGPPPVMAILHFTNGLLTSVT